ncbi:MAG TPA: S8 family peptidase [Chloroflexota bacterium]|nr:S8 family peptidase [Chloroflexota bacterium]
MKPPLPSARVNLLVLLLALSLLLSVTHPPISQIPLAWASPDQSETPAAQSDRQDFVPGELLVKLRGESPELPLSLIQSLGYPISVLEKMEGVGVLRLSVPAGREMESIQLLTRSPLVEWAEPNGVAEALRIPDDPLYGQYQWDLWKIQAEQAWEISTGSRDIVVAVLDTGIDATHPDLEGKLVPGYDFLNDGPTPEDNSGHGTHNAGIIGAATNNAVGVAGIAWNCRIMPVKVLNSNGTGPESVIARGIMFAADQGAKVINMSFGSPTSSRVLSDAVQYAYNKGALLIAGAGNTAKTNNSMVYPAAFDQVLAVAATDENDEIGDFSQHHPYVGISAPGMRILNSYWRGSASSGYQSASGTSAAAPHVSGVAALIKSVNPALTNTQVKQILMDTSDDLGEPGVDEYFGAGRLNAYKALLVAKLTLATPTPPSPAATPSPAASPSTAATPTVAVTPSATVPTAAPTPTAPTITPTPPVQSSTARGSVWYFAEGSTAGPFDLWLLLQNPNEVAISARVTYMKPDGSQQAQSISLAPNSRKSIFVNEVIPNSEVSMKVESDDLLLAERAMYFRTDGIDTVGVSAPSTHWYMAEGSTKADFDSWILLQNPQPNPARVTATFLTVQGQRKEMNLVMPPTSRRSIYANEVIPDAEISTTITSDQPIIAERSMYFRRAGGHGGAAANQLSRTWYLAEGRVGDGFDSWLLAMNPNQSPANLKVTYMREGGATTPAYYSIRPGSRLSVFVNDAVDSGRVGAMVESDQPIVVERSSYFAEGRGGHNVVGTTALSRDWYLPEGSTQRPFTEEIALLNPSEHPAALLVTFMKPDGGTTVRYAVINPTSRLTLKVNDLMPDAEISTRVISDTPISVERSMYFADGLGGTGAPGIPR